MVFTIIFIIFIRLKQASSIMPKSFMNFSISQTIGTGTFGKVKKAKHVPTSQDVAIKLLNKSKILTQKDSERVNRQIEILKSIDHEKIIKLYQLQQTAKTFYLITQLVQGQQLFQKINRLGNLDQETSRLYFVQLLDALLYLKSKGICHRDIKPQNIIVKGQQIKLIDFGLSNYFIKGQKLQTSCGSPCYAAPQMMSQNSYDPMKTQVWALGVTLYAMLTGRLPFQHTNTSKLYKMMQNNKYEDVSNISNSLKGLLRGMIEVNPSLRLTLDEIKDHIWIKSAKYNFQNQKKQHQWNQIVLQIMKKNFNLSVQDLKYKIQKQFGQQSIYYYLSLKQTALKSISPYSIHQGPLHFGFVFPDLAAVKEQIFKLMPYERIWVNQSIVKSSKIKATIKKVPVCQMFYLQLQNI